MTDRPLTPGHVARLLGVTTETLRRWRDAGEGPPWLALAGRTVRYPAGALNAWRAARGGDGPQAGPQGQR